jgi:hypothetical protein
MQKISLHPPKTTHKKMKNFHRFNLYFHNFLFHIHFVYLELTSEREKIIFILISRRKII